MAEPVKEASGDQSKTVAGADACPVVTSVFVSEPEGLPGQIDHSFWAALPAWGGLETIELAADVAPATSFRVSHDANMLAVHARCEEPEMGSLWLRRTAESGRLDLDDSVEILLDPYHAHGFRWSVVATPAGPWEATIPVGACARPECAVEVRTSDTAWEALIRIPFVDIGIEGDLRGTPINGDVWGLAVVRRRREALSGPQAGRREISAWAASHGGPPAAEVFGHLKFEGGRNKRPAELMKCAAGGYGVNEICVSLEGGKIPEGLEVGLKPAPAARLRSKDASRYKFRVARPGLYRYLLRLPYVPPPDPTEDELAELEGEAGRELSEDEIAAHLADRAGTPEYVAGLSFVLRDLWADLEEKELEVEGLKQKLDEAGIKLNDRKQKLFGAFESALNDVDRYRAPHAKVRLGPEQIEQLNARFADVCGAARGALLRAGKLSVASMYASAGAWYHGVLRVRTSHSDGTEVAGTIVPKLRAAGMQFAAFADRPEGGDQDGDGTHDWNGDGTVAPAARRIDAAGTAVREDRGREAYVRDYSKTAAEQGKGWVTENWRLSSDGEFVVLRAVETGPHYPALCLGVPAGALPPGTADCYDQIAAAQDRGGVAVMCEAPGDMRSLPLELSQVVGIDAPADAWERLLRGGRRVLLFPGTKLDGADLKGSSLPAKAAYVGVFAETLTEKALLAALRRGSFYVTTGPRITGVEVKGDTITIRTGEQCQIFFRNEMGQVLGGAFGTEASYRFTGKERLVRAVCLSDVFEDGFRLEATTQPFCLTDLLLRSPLGPIDEGWTIAEPVDRSDEPEVEEPEEELKEPAKPEEDVDDDEDSSTDDESGEGDESEDADEDAADE